MGSILRQGQTLHAKHSQEQCFLTCVIVQSAFTSSLAAVVTCAVVLSWVTCVTVETTFLTVVVVFVGAPSTKDGKSERLIPPNVFPPPERDATFLVAVTSKRENLFIAVGDSVKSMTSLDVERW